ncbi:MAG: histidine kinase [Lachnospiraceae bacterium]
MKKIKKKHEVFGFLRKLGIQKQLYIIYMLAVLMPVSLIGSFLVGNTYRLLTNYHGDLLESDNLRVRTILFEITTQVYNISEELSFNVEIESMLKKRYAYREEFTSAINRNSEIVDNYANHYTEIEQVEIYCDNPDICDYKQYRRVDGEIEKSDWYRRAISQSSVFWQEMRDTDKYGNEYWNLCLIRQVPLVNSEHHAVLVIRISNNYLKTRIGSQKYQICVSVDNGVVFFALDRADYGKPQPVTLDSGKKQKIQNQTCLVEISELGLYLSDSHIYICTMDNKSYDNIKSIIRICILIILVAVLVPGILVYYFGQYFTKRVRTLRHVMYQASNEDYDFKEMVRGQDELSEAFSDLEVMVQNIKEKDAHMYEVLLKEQELTNEQQKMEFKMLASQINPHFLYNTLETIRMKAYTVGDKEVATAIKLLGKSMRYVLENNGTAFTALKEEMDYIEIYMKIQKLRFMEKFDYELKTQDGIDLYKCITLPLLLQPIVENAILHGLEETEKGGMVTIKIGQEPQNNGIYIAVSDNGCGIEKETLERLRVDIVTKNPLKKESIGLYNINQRVKLCYGNEYGMTIDSIVGSGTTVTLHLPQKVYHDI